MFLRNRTIRWSWKNAPNFKQTKSLTFWAPVMAPPPDLAFFSSTKKCMGHSSASKIKPIITMGGGSTPNPKEQQLLWWVVGVLYSIFSTDKLQRDQLTYQADQDFCILQKWMMPLSTDSHHGWFTFIPFKQLTMGLGQNQGSALASAQK